MKISVALCTYNGENFLKEQLHSIFSQTLSVDEIIICDDCSTDSTVNIVEGFMVRFPDIIKLYKNEYSLKTIKNFEKAITLTTGDYIFLCDQDDIWLPTKTEKMIAHIIASPKILLLFTNGELINAQGKALGSTLWEQWGFDIDAKNLWSKMRNAFDNLLNNKNYVTGATVLFKSKLKEKGLPIDIPEGYFHDAWFAMHAAAQNGLFYLDESLIKYRIHEDQQVGIKKFGEITTESGGGQSILVKDFVENIYKMYPSFKPKITLKNRIKSLIYKTHASKYLGKLR